ARIDACVEMRRGGIARVARHAGGKKFGDLQHGARIEECECGSLRYRNPACRNSTGPKRTPGPKDWGREKIGATRRGMRAYSAAKDCGLPPSMALRMCWSSEILMPTSSYFLRAVGVMSPTRAMAGSM